MAVQIAESLQPVALLQLAEQAFVEGTQAPGIDLVEALAQAGIARDRLDAVDLEVGRRGPRATILVELQQRRILQAEQCQSQHQVIDQRNVAGRLVGNLQESLAYPMQQAARAQSL